MGNDDSDAVSLFAGANLQLKTESGFAGVHDDPFSSATRKSANTISQN